MSRHTWRHRSNKIHFSSLSANLFLLFFLRRREYLWGMENKMRRKKCTTKQWPHKTHPRKSTRDWKGQRTANHADHFIRVCFLFSILFFTFFSNTRQMSGNMMRIRAREWAVTKMIMAILWRLANIDAAPVSFIALTTFCRFANSPIEKCRRNCVMMMMLVVDVPYEIQQKQHTLATSTMTTTNTIERNGDDVVCSVRRWRRQPNGGVEELATAATMTTTISSASTATNGDDAVKDVSMKFPQFLSYFAFF